MQPPPFSRLVQPTTWLLVQRTTRLPLPIAKKDTISAQVDFQLSPPLLLYPLLPFPKPGGGSLIRGGSCSGSWGRPHHPPRRKPFPQLGGGLGRDGR